jgi:hypothetical protein
MAQSLLMKVKVIQFLYSLAVFVCLLSLKSPNAEKTNLLQLHEMARIFLLNSNKSPTRCNNFPVYFLTFIYSSTCFGRFPAHHQELNDRSGSLWFYLRIVVTVKLLMMGGKTPETC